MVFFPVDQYTSLDHGRFTHVPIITGNQEDEATLFSLMLSKVTSSDLMVDYFQSWFPSTPRAIVAGLVDSYPCDKQAGSPFHTGNKYELFPEYKRIAALMGDYSFTLARRVCLAFMIPTHADVWSYLASYYHSVPALGTYHGTDNGLQFNNSGPSLPRVAILTYYVSFVNHGSPNAGQAPGLPFWPRYAGFRPQLLHLQAQDITVKYDDFRMKSYKYLEKYRKVLLQ